MKTTKIFKSIFLLLLLMFVGIQNIAAVVGTYTYNADIEVQGVKYRCYTVTAPIGSTGYTHTVGYFARVLSIAYVTTAECVIPATVENAGITYIVEGISREFYTNNHKIETLKFTGNVGTKNTSYSYIHSGSYSYGVFVGSIVGEDLGVDFSRMYLPNLKTLIVPNFEQTGSVDEWKFEGGDHFPNLEDVYVTDGCPTLSYGMFTRASHITMHIPPQYIRESMKTAAVWSDFKDIVPFSWNYSLTFWNCSKRYVKIYSLGNKDYSSATPLPPPSVTGKENSSKSMVGNLGENYLVTCEYDPETEDVPTVTRNDEPIDENDLFEVEDGVVGYQESDLHEHVSYKVNANHKQCRVTFYGGEGYIAGTYEIRRDGTRHYGNIFNGFIDCDYGSEVRLTMPATPYLLNDDLKLTFYNTGTPQNITLPTPVDGNYEIVFSVPSISAARFSYAYVIPQGEGESIPDPVITLMRMGEGEVKLTKFWEWGEQDEAYRNIETINCVNPTTSIAIPRPEDEGWGYRLEVTPLKGQKLRNLLIGYIMKGDNGAPSKIYWGDYLSWTSCDTTTNTYTFTVDTEQGGGDEFDMEDYNVLVDMGPTETIVEDGYKQTIVCKGSTQSKVWFSGETSTELSGDCAATVIMDDESDYDHFVTINLAKGEKFTAYRDGEDVTSQFEYYGDAYHYEFFDESYFYASGWTIIFEKDENVVTGYDWTVVGQSLPEETKLTIVYKEGEEDEVEEVHVLNPGANKIHINASGLQSARFDIQQTTSYVPMISCDGVDMSDRLSLVDGVQSLSVPALQILDATWVIGTQEATAWTILKTDNVVGAEVVVAYDSENVTTSLTDRSTDVPIQKALSAVLRVPRSLTSTTYDLYLTGYANGQKMAVIRAIRSVIPDLGLAEASALLDKPFPIFLKAYDNLQDAQAAKTTLEATENASISTNVMQPSNLSTCVMRDGNDVTSQATEQDGYICFSLSGEALTKSTWVILTEDDLKRYDCNRDGQISIADVTTLVNKILGKE
jgi:hypothetical protein